MKWLAFSLMLFHFVGRLFTLLFKPQDESGRIADVVLIILYVFASWWIFNV